MEDFTSIAYIYAVIPLWGIIVNTQENIKYLKRIMIIDFLVSALYEDKQITHKEIKTRIVYILKTNKELVTVKDLFFRGMTVALYTILLLSVNMPTIAKIMLVLGIFLLVIGRVLEQVELRQANKALIKANKAISDNN